MNVIPNIFAFLFLYEYSNLKSFSILVNSFKLKASKKTLLLEMISISIVFFVQQNFFLFGSTLVMTILISYDYECIILFKISLNFLSL